MLTQKCRCNSGRTRHALYDAAGIFLCYVCDECEDAKRATYDPHIFKQSSSYAVTGEEEDIGRYPGEDY